jgi:NAD(P)-dependent dehydrogenase (short-subunit alcohol dehydrogenase family)
MTAPSLPVPVALVTGASAGIGQAICRRLLAAGRTVITLQRGVPEERHERLLPFQVDLSDPVATQAIARRLAGEYNVRWLVHNAGANRPALLEDATVDDMRHVSDITLVAGLVLAQAFVPRMREERFGRIVFISSRAALGKRARAVYSAAKAGLVGMTRTLAIETGADGITVNAVLPGPVATAHFDRGHPPGSEQRQTVIDNILVGRIGTPEDVAHAVDFLLDDASDFVTGQALFVCGGTSVTGTGGQ